MGDLRNALRRWANLGWDSDGSYVSAATKIIRAASRGTGTRLTASEVRSINFAEGDGDWWQALNAHLSERGK